VLRLLYRNDLRGLDDPHEIVDGQRKMDDLSLVDLMMDDRLMVWQKMGGKKDDRLMVALDDHCFLDALPCTSPDR
jgi:hypothetical protein